MKNFFQKFIAPVLGLALMAAALLAPAPAKAAGTFYMNSLLGGTQLVISNNFTFSTTNNGVTPMTYTPRLSEQYPVGFGGGTNWWANGWTTYTNSSGIIVTNPLSGFVTNTGWATDARLWPDGNGNVATSIGIFAQLLGPDTTSTNAVTITLGGCVGTNHLLSAQNLFTFTITGTGTNLPASSLVTNPPAAFLEGIDGVYVEAISANNKNTNCYLNQLAVTGFAPMPPN